MCTIEKTVAGKNRCVIIEVMNIKSLYKKRTEEKEKKNIKSKKE